MVIIRADGNARIGAGHLMRCLSIANRIEEEVLFVCADEASAQMAESHGFQAVALGTDYRDMESEIKSEMWIKGSDNTILVDSYYVTPQYLQALQKYGKVFLLDDMQETAYPVDGVINYNIFADEKIYQELYANTGTLCYLGGSYVPLREQFVEVPYEVQPTVREVMITTGGGDVDNIALAVWQAIDREEILFHVLVGRFSPHFEKWQELARVHANLQIHFDVADMAGLMQQCDLAITAGGSTIYELAAVGVPFICLAYARNQEALVAEIGKRKVAGSAGNWHIDRELCLREIKRQFDELALQAEMRKRYCEKERALIDGQGARRIAEVLLRE